ncbi:Na+/H+ antiporter NhaC family protein [Pseudalkalibacillus decolorationis]|uniref:Na+/H+ antiporter NhaC family protein n=1 Tax=Pseudalkalibacillus decolorationis TaxID=163879 RepID=UPI0021497D44|nr:Na+/H+ antiporter NhaC family protein [Pseudalkalibacillus decolorationis]
MDRYSGKQVFLLVVITLTGIISSFVLNQPLAIGFLPGFFYLIFLGWKKGVSFKEIRKISYIGVKRIKVVLFILFFVSFLLPSWYLSGTINEMVSVTMEAIDPQHFFVLSFLTTMLFSMITGTSLGTLSALGIPLISTAILMGLPIEVTAGAVISGAFVGDRTSPFSGTHQLLSRVLEISVRKQGKAMLLTTIIGIAAAVLFYRFMDVQFSTELQSSPNKESNQSITFIPFIPPLLLIVPVLFRIDIIKSFLFSILSASVIAIYDGHTLFKIANAYWKGIDSLGGGLLHMYGLLVFIALAGAYNSLLEDLNIIQPLLNKWLHSSRSMVSDSVKTTIATLMVSLMAANQTMPIILTGRSFLAHWTSKYSKEELARVMGDTTMLFPAIVPWNVLAILASTIISMPLGDYLPYAVFLWFLPCLTIIVSMFKKGRSYDSKYKAVS